MNKQPYLPHIDGLRALSVILVILFHFNVGVFTGGFIGVDVFFTISGYLIIGSIVAQLGKGEFSPLSFWQRRIRRLVPAILATLLLCFIAGFLIMSPANFEHLARQSCFALFSIINFTLLGEGDYFDQSSLDEPLVHFWSLSVEEQFYLAFPLLALAIFAMVRKKANFKKTMGVLLLILSILSIIGAEYMIRTGHKSAAYYMMPTRFSQLALGGLLAIYLQTPSSEKFTNGISSRGHGIISAVGLGLICWVSVYFKSTTAFPGLNSLLPTLGALAVLGSGGRGGTKIKELLENKVSSYIGKLSYSLYLVHWPVWVFLCYYLNYVMDGFEVLLPVTLTFAISALIYHFVEKPIRFSKRFSGKLMYRSILPSLTVFLVFSGMIFVNKGMDSRLDAQSQEFLKAYPDTADYHRVHFGGNGYGAGVVTKLGDPKMAPDFLIIGDSKARQLATGLDEFLKSTRRQVVMINYDGCPFITSAQMYINGVLHKDCHAATQLARDYAMKTQIPILSIRSWIFYQNHLRDMQGRPFRYRKKHESNKFAEMFINDHETLYAQSNLSHPILMVGDNAGFRNVKPISDCQARPNWVKAICLKRKSFKVSHFETPSIETALDKKAQKSPYVQFMSMTEIFCSDGLCTQMEVNSDILNSDPYHLSKIGSRKIAPILLAKARKVFDLKEYVPQVILDPCSNKTPNVERKKLEPPFGENGSVGWHIALPNITSKASNNEFPNRSQYVLCENEKSFGTANSMHATIREIGKGHYSHWDTHLIFSTSDNSKPNDNGKTYELVLSSE